MGARQRVRVEHRGKQRIDGIRGNLHERGLALEQSFVVHLHGDADRGEPGALAVAGLQHVELLVLDRELEVLHVAEMALELGAHILEFVVEPRHVVGQLGDRLRRPHARHDIFALGVY